MDPRSHTSAHAHRVVTVWHTVRGQPGWVRRAALTAFALVVAVPFLVLLLLAVVLAVAVFGAAALVNLAMHAARRFGPRRDGRKNVIVRRRL